MADRGSVMGDSLTYYEKIRLRKFENKLDILEKLIMAKGKNVYDIEYEVTETIKGEEPYQTTYRTTVLAQNHVAAIKAAEKEALEEFSTEELKISDFSLLSFKLVNEIKLFG